MSIDTGTITTTARVNLWPAEVWWAGYCVGSTIPAGVELREDGIYRDPSRPELGWAGHVSSPLNVGIMTLVRGWGSR